MKHITSLKVFGLLVLLLVFSDAFGGVYSNGPYKEVTSVNGGESYSVLNDSIDLKELITKEIIYDAPKSGMVNFCWYTNDFSKEELMTWNKNAKIFKKTVYVPMLKNNHGQFIVSITMPKDSKISYGFWITKSSTGVYQDIWNWHDENITFNNEQTQTIQAAYSQNEENKTSLAVSSGWLIFLAVSLIFLILNLLNRFWFKNLVKTPLITKVILLGVALFLFHLLARSEIIKLHPKSLLVDWGNVLKLFKASWQDLIYVSALVSVVVIALFFTKKNKLRNIIFWTFKGIVFMSALFAFTNITTVKFLGHPFNYEWFYYSDFLGSEDSINAIKENLTLFTILNLVALSLSVFILEKIMEYTAALINASKHLKYPTYIFVFIAIVFSAISSFSLDKKYDKGTIENPVLAMATSIINNDKAASFFDFPLDDQDTFNPREGTRLNLENHSKEKVIKNVIFIVLESSGAQYFDAYGGRYNITPNLNAYAEKAILYKNAYAHVPATTKSMVALLGSMYPYISYKGLTNEKPNFDHPTVPSILKQRGYKTSFFTSADLNYMKGKQFLQHRGFDTIEDFSNINCSSSFKQDIYDNGDAIDDLCLTDRFGIWLKNNKNSNFFSTIWTVQGHYPYFFSQEEEDFKVDNMYFNRYLNTIKQCDQMIGDIIDVLKENQLFESTLIVVTADHGEAFNQHNNNGHASTIYEENIKIPLYFINPLLFNGAQREDNVSMKDIASTTLSLLDIEVPPSWQGRDIISTQHDEVFFFAPYSDYLFGYKKGNKKFIFNETTKSVEVFDLLNDPQEKINISHQIPESELTHAKKRIASWVQYHDKFVTENLLN